MGMTSKEAIKEAIDECEEAKELPFGLCITKESSGIVLEALHLLEKQEQGLVVELPCKLELGQKWYYIGFGTPIEFEIIDFNWWLSSGLVAETYGKFPHSSKLPISFSWFGELCSLTREEAEAKLKEMESKNEID